MKIKRIFLAVANLNKHGNMMALINEHVSLKRAITVCI